MSSRVRRTAALATTAVGIASALAACGNSGDASSAVAAGGSSTASTPPPSTTAARAAAARPRFVSVPIKIPAANRGFGAGEVRVRLPRGWRIEVWALVPGARLMAWAPGGELLVSSPSEGKVLELDPRGSPAKPPAAHTIVSGLTNPQGLAFDRLHGHELLYVAESDELDRYVWRGHGVGARTVLVPNLPDGGAHPLKNVVVGSDHTLYVDIGSDSNADPPSAGGITRATVIAYRPDGHQLRVFATGVRNGDGLSFAPDGSLWTAVNERDDIAYPFHRPYGGHADAYGRVMTSYVANHPPDEIARLTPGRNLGWPFCDPDPDLKPGAAGTRERYGNLHFDDDVQTNAGGSRLDCAKLAPIQRGIPAHSAPLGFHFLFASSLPMPWRNGAVVGVHGSWDRVPPRAPAVLWMPWRSSSHTLGPAIPLVGGFQHADGSRWGRSVDAVPGPGGALYVSDDAEGAVYRVVP
jgi:glucose/arabinose dehydrogenase